MKNTTTPMDDNGDDSFEDWYPTTPEELEAAFGETGGDSMSDEEWEECILRGQDEFDDTEAQMFPRDHELPGDMDPESW